MTQSDLLEVVYRFYPRGLYTTGLGYEDTEERHRQRDVARRAVAGYPTWQAMIRRLGARYTFRNGSIRILGRRYLEGSYDPGYSGSIEIPGYEIGFGVSLLGPYYGIHREGVPASEAPALDLAREIEATYPGTERIPPELGNEVVPDVTLDTRGFGEASFYECLLAENWVDLSGPYPPPPSTVPPPAYEPSLGVRLPCPERRARRETPETPAREPEDGELADDEPHDDPNRSLGEVDGRDARSRAGLTLHARSGEKHRESPRLA